MLPSPSQVETARRALKAIKDGGRPTKADAIALQKYAGPIGRTVPIKDIANEIMRLAKKSN
jgi:hypothetical protein